MKKFIIRDRETGTCIEEVETLDDAKKLLKKYEEEDKQDGIYEENFYEIYDAELEEII